jgi:hypothetical protein
MTKKNEEVNEQIALTGAATLAPRPSAKVVTPITNQPGGPIEQRGQTLAPRPSRLTPAPTPTPEQSKSDN